MPTRTTPRRTAGTTSSRLSRPGAAPWTSRASRTSAGRFGRPLSVQRPPARGRRKQPTGMSALLGALPIGGAKKGKSTRGGSSRTKPAMAMLAAAGAVLGRRQMRRRRAADVPPPAPQA